MSRKYKFHDSRSPHFVSFSVVNWIDLFTRKEYFDIMIESLSYCVEHKGLIMNAWCIMTNHVHLIIRSDSNQLEDILRDMKKFTSKRLIEEVKMKSGESRKDWILWMFKRAGEKNKQLPQNSECPQQVANWPEKVIDRFIGGKPIVFQIGFTESYDFRNICFITNRREKFHSIKKQLSCVGSCNVWIPLRLATLFKGNVCKLI